jgi:hypothetical protein
VSVKAPVKQNVDKIKVQKKRKAVNHVFTVACSLKNEHNFSQPCVEQSAHSTVHAVCEMKSVETKQKQS